MARLSERAVSMIRAMQINGAAVSRRVDFGWKASTAWYVLNRGGTFSSRTAGVLVKSGLIERDPDQSTYVVKNPAGVATGFRYVLTPAGRTYGTRGGANG